MTGESSARFPTDGLGKRPRWAYLIYGCLGILLLLFCIAAGWSLTILRQEMTGSILEHRETIAHLAATALEEKFDHLATLGVSLATRVRFRKLIGAGKWREAVNILQKVPRDFPIVDRILIADPQGTLRADIPPRPEVKGVNFASRDWYQGVSRQGAPYISEIYTRAAQPRIKVTAVAVPITAEEGKLLGILVLQVPVRVFFGWSRLVEAGRGESIYFIDKNGSLAGYSEDSAQSAAFDLLALPLVQKALHGKSGSSVGLAMLGNEKQLFACTHLKKYPWAAIVQQPAREAFAARTTTLRTVAGLYAVIFLLVCVFVYLVIRLIMERRLAEAQMRRTSLALERSNQDLEQFAYAASHDLQEPLRKIASFTQLLAKNWRGRFDAESDKHIAYIVDGAARMQLLIRDLLTYSLIGKESISSARVDCAAVLAEIAESLPVLESSAAITWDLLPTVEAAKVEIVQLFQNLLSNALKFRGSQPPRIHVSAKRAGAAAPDAEDAWLFSVKDNGIGIDPRYADRIFLIFQRLHPRTEYPGTGVGLALCKKIVERHGGRIWVESQEGQGATFYFTFPAKPRGETA